MAELCYRDKYISIYFRKFQFVCCLYSRVLWPCCMAVRLGLKEGRGGYAEGEKDLWR